MEKNNSSFWLSVISATLFSAGLVYYLIYALKTRKIWLVGGFGKASKFFRDSEPVGYWMTVLMYLFLIFLIWYLATLNPAVHNFFEQFSQKPT
jgi:hypothetical protein